MIVAENTAQRPPDLDSHLCPVTSGVSWACCRACFLVYKVGTLIPPNEAVVKMKCFKQQHSAGHIGIAT